MSEQQYNMSEASPKANRAHGIPAATMKNAELLTHMKLDAPNDLFVFQKLFEWVLRQEIPPQVSPVKVPLCCAASALLSADKLHRAALTRVPPPARRGHARRRARQGDARRRDFTRRQAAIETKARGGVALLSATAASIGWPAWCGDLRSLLTRALPQRPSLALTFSMRLAARFEPSFLASRYSESAS